MFPTSTGQEPLEGVLPWGGSLNVTPEQQKVLKHRVQLSGESLGREWKSMDSLFTCHQQEFLVGWWLLEALLLQAIWGSQSHKKALSLPWLHSLVILSKKQNLFAFSKTTRSIAHVVNLVFPGATRFTHLGQRDPLWPAAPAISHPQKTSLCCAAPPCAHKDFSNFAVNGNFPPSP